MNSYKKLFNNTLIFAIGSFGSNIVSFLLVPLYTYYLSTEDYGTVDLIISTVAMLVPFVTVSVYEAVIRFAIEDRNKNGEILSNALIIQTSLFCIFILCFPVLNWFNIFGDYLLYFYIILYLQSIQMILQQFARGIGYLKIYAFNGVLTTLTLGVSNVVLVSFLNMSIKGYLFATVLSFGISNLYLIYSTKALRYLKFEFVNLNYVKKLLAYSLPMVPNSIMYRVTNSASRYFILFYLGTSANGLFAVSSKIPLVINMINSIFIQAWQLSAFEEYENENKHIFYSTTFKYLSTILFVSTSLILVILKPMFQLLFSENFYGGWIPVPFLILGVVFSSFSGFLGTNYTASKQTSGVFKTSIFGGLCTLLFSFLFIPTIGLIGAGITSMISFYIVFIIRYFDTQKFIKIVIDWKVFYLNLLYIFIQTIILFLDFPLDIECLLSILVLVLILVTNYKVMYFLILNFWNIFSKRKNRK